MKMNYSNLEHHQGAIYPNAMTFQTERMLFGAGSMLSAALFQMAAIFSPAESRWIFVTLATSIMMALCLTLIFKGKDDTINFVVGRAVFSIMSGILLTKPFVYYLNIETVHSDIIILSGCASICCIAGYIVGVAILRYLMKNSDYLAKKFVDSKVTQYFPPES